MAIQNVGVKLKVTASGFNTQLAKIKSTMASVTGKVNSGFGSWYNSVRKTNQQVVNLNKDLNRSGTLFKGFGKSFGGMGMLTGAASLWGMSSALQGSIKSAMDMVETINLFNVSLGETSDEAYIAVKRMSDLTGLDLTNLQNAVGTYALLAQSMGMSSEQAEKLSINTTKMAVDFSSLTNIPIQQVMADLKSGLVGQSETVYKYGIDVTEAGIKAEAMRQGITKSVRSMSQGEKMALRAATMVGVLNKKLSDGGTISGDFARTIEQPANQARILTERLTTLGRSIGSIFIPMLTVVLPYLNAFVIVLIEMANAIATFFGYVDPNKTKKKSDGIKTIGDDADDTADSIDKMAKAAKDSTMPFDELNQISKASGGGNKGGEDTGSIIDQIDIGTVTDIFDKIKTKANQLAKDLKKIFIDVYNKLKEMFGPLVSQIWEGMLWVYNNILVPIGTWLKNDVAPKFLDLLGAAANFLADALEALEPFGKWLYDEFLVPIGKWVGREVVETILALTDAFTGLSDWIKNNKGATKILEILAAIAFFATPFGQMVLFMKIFTTLAKASEDFGDKARIALTNFGKFFSDFVTVTIPAKITELVNWFKGLPNRIAYHIGFIIGKIIRFGFDLGLWIKNDLPLVIDKIIAWFKGLPKRAYDELMKINDKMASWLVNIITWVDKKLPLLIDDFMSWFTNIPKNFGTAITKIGKDIINGIFNGMANIGEKVKGWSESFLQGIKDGLGIKSPSKIMRKEVGVNIGLGLIQGLNDTRGKIVGTALGISGEMSDALNGVSSVGGYSSYTADVGVNATMDIKTAVFDAVSAAVATIDMSGQVINNVTTLDGEVIYKNQQKVSQARGYSFGMGDFTR